MTSDRTDANRPQIDGYRISRVIGHGGMSVVYLGEQVSLGRKVALKVMLPEALEDEVSRGRFENEARTIARLQHPHIVGIHEVGRTRDGLPFYAMPHLPRGHLAQRDLRGEQAKVAAILRSLLQALDYAHVRGVVHRDVKAENVLFDENERPQLADFGIALRRGSNPRLTSTGLAVGSTAYMPPEQARGAEVDRRADLYSVGVLAWEMLTGRLPYNAADALSMAMMHTQDPIPRLPAVLKHWQPLVDKALAKKPDQRFSSAIEMLAALDALEARSGRAFAKVEIPTQAPAGDPRPGRRGLGWKPVVLALAALVVVGLGSATWLERAGAPEPAAAQVAVASDSDIGDTLPSPEPGAQTGVLTDIETDPLEPGAGAAYIANAEQQLRAGQLLAPANANAWDSWDAAWRIDARGPQVQMLTARLFDALAEASERALRAGDTGTSRDAFRRAQQLDARRGGDGSAVALLRSRLYTAMDARLSTLVAKPDRAAAESLLAASKWLDLDAARSKALQRKLAGLARAEPAVAAGPAGATRGASIITVTRADYARFAAATSRGSAPCGRSGVFGAKRTWSSPGDRQGAGAPVVCVSAADAQAYAAWRSAQEPGRLRLPSAGELKAQPGGVSAWLTLCADQACSRRMASGQARPLDARQGNPTVGIRLVRER